MVLALYSQYISYPSGTPAANVQVNVHTAGGNVLIPLFLDQAGTVPQANPATTDGDGLLMFYAAPGDFYAEFFGELFQIRVDAAHTDPVHSGVYVHTQVSAQTVWTIDHHIGIEPRVSVLVGGAETSSEVTHPTTEQAVITFAAPTSGVAHLRR